MRAYLGLEYLFFDFGFRIGAQFNTGSGLTSTDPAADTNEPMMKFMSGVLPSAHLTFALGQNILF